ALAATGGRAAAGPLSCAAAAAARRAAAVVVPLRDRSCRRRRRSRSRSRRRARGVRGVSEATGVGSRAPEPRLHPRVLGQQLLEVFRRRLPVVAVQADELVGRDELVLQPGGRLDPPHGRLVVALGKLLGVQNVQGQVFGDLGLSLRLAPERSRRRGRLTRFLCPCP
ncbi:unnamed protein product, partial [Scytosiphon promiscuus]